MAERKIASSSKAKVIAQGDAEVAVAGVVGGFRLVHFWHPDILTVIKSNILVLI